VLPAGISRRGRDLGARFGQGRLGPMFMLARRTALDARDDRITGLAAEITFFAVVAIPPLLLVIVGGLGFVSDLIGTASTASMRSSILDGARVVLNDSTVRDTIRPTLDNLLERGRADVVSLGAIVALWSSSRATKVAVVAITIAYDVPRSRSRWRRRAVAVGLTAGAIASAVVVLPLMVMGPRLLTDGLSRMGMGAVAAPLAAVVHWLLTAALAVALLATLTTSRRHGGRLGVVISPVRCSLSCSGSRARCWCAPMSNGLSHLTTRTARSPRRSSSCYGCTSLRSRYCSAPN